MVFLSKKMLPHKFTSYPELGEFSSELDEYEFVKLVGKNTEKLPIADEQLTLKDILYDEERKTHYLVTSGGKKEYDPLIKIYWKLNERGEVIDSLSLPDHGLYRSGVIFFEDHYYDWFNTGHKTKKSYSEINDDTSYSLEEVIASISEATMVDASINYENYNQLKINLYMYKNKVWSLLKSTKLYESLNTETKKPIGYNCLNGRLSVVVAPYTINAKERFYDLNSYYGKQNLPEIKVDAFVKESYYKPPLFNTRSSGSAGWKGTGYLTLEYHSLSVAFKQATFKTSSYTDTKIYIYPPAPNTVQELVFVKTGDQQAFLGLYVLRERNP